MDKMLYCGASVRNVNPYQSIIDRLPGRDDTFLDDLHIRVIALGDGTKKIPLIAYESGYNLIEEQYQAIQERFGLPEEDVMIFDCHSHTKLYGEKEGRSTVNPRKRFHLWDEWPLEEREAMKEYGLFARGEMLEAIDEAIKNMRPARAGHAQGQSYVNVCRNQKYTIEMPDGTLKEHYTIGVDPGADIDHTVFVMEWKDVQTEKPIAFFMNYPVHNCAVIGNHCGKNGNRAWSADIGGNCSDYMEQKYPGCVAMWCSGPAGNINPSICNQVIYPDPMNGAPVRYFPKENELALLSLKLLSTRHFADIMDTVRSIDHWTDRTRIKTAIEISCTPGLDENSVVHDDLYKVRMQTIRIGDVVLMGFSGELYDSFGKEIRAISPMKNTVLVTHVAMGVIISEYILDDWALSKSAAPEKRMGMGRRDAKDGWVGVELPNIADCIIGTEHSQIVPGYLSESFEKHTLSLMDKVL